MSMNLKTAFACIFSIVSCTWYLAVKLNAGNALLEGLTARVTAIESNRYRISDASEQALRLAIENPGLRVPDPRNTADIIVVAKSSSVEHRP